jgi:hypothetical protein
MPFPEITTRKFPYLLGDLPRCTISSRFPGGKSLSPRPGTGPAAAQIINVFTALPGSFPIDTNNHCDAKK